MPNNKWLIWKKSAAINCSNCKTQREDKCCEKQVCHVLEIVMLMTLLKNNAIKRRKYYYYNCNKFTGWKKSSQWIWYFRSVNHFFHSYLSNLDLIFCYRRILLSECCWSCDFLRFINLNNSLYVNYWKLYFIVMFLNTVEVFLMRFFQIGLLFHLEKSHSTCMGFVLFEWDVYI